MNPEKVFSMCTEGTLNLTDIGRGGKPTFTKEDARHALAGMTRLQQYFTEFVFLLHDESLGKLTRCLTECVMTEAKGDFDIVYRLCRINSVLWRKPNAELCIYREANISRQKWRSTYHKISNDIKSTMMGIENEISDHIYKKTR